MGQYHIPVNLDKREFIHPHKLACGLKLWEQLANHPGIGGPLVVLLAASNGRGGGDFRTDDPDGIIGRWAGDRIAIIGDYAESGDLPATDYAEFIYEACWDEDDDPIDPKNPFAPDGFKDISEAVAKIIESELEGRYTGSGWRDFESTT